MSIVMLLIACGGDPADEASPTAETEDTSAPDTASTASTAVGCDGDDGAAATFTIQPYLQQVTPTSAWILWETADGVGSRVDVGVDGLERTACGQRIGATPGADPDDAGTQVHVTPLDGLTPDTTYTYQARTGATSSAVLQFRTAPSPDQEQGFHLVAMSDSQRDDAHPEVFGELLRDGVMPVLEAEGDAAFVLFPGDLVDNGWRIEEWQDEFFGPGADLWARSPVYPAIGNHEGGSPLYFRYFHLPEEDGLAEHAWHHDYSNLRVLALDSNGYKESEQLAWLDAQLDEACARPELDFVFAQLHHPMRSELWVPGESDFTAEVVAKLEAFSTACGKPSVHFFGHTHGYSRGQSRDHEHLMVNVASAGGALDRWGEQSQQDYDAFTVSQDTYGFVTVHVEAGSAPSFRLTRYNRGTPEAPLTNVVSDAITVLRDNAPPRTPVPVPVACPLVIALDGFDDPEGHGHQATHWQVDFDCTFTDPFVDVWRQDRNEYLGTDLQAGDDLLDEALQSFGSPGTPMCWRARVRDAHLAWSQWSEPLRERVPRCE